MDCTPRANPRVPEIRDFFAFDANARKTLPGLFCRFRPTTEDVNALLTVRP
jgi:hypothetical protein